MTTNSFVKSNSIGFNNNIKNDFNIFPKEFINRIDEIITFNNATLESVRQIIKDKEKEYNDKFDKIKLEYQVNKKKYLILQINI